MTEQCLNLLRAVVVLSVAAGLSIFVPSFRRWASAGGAFSANDSGHHSNH